jgi:hypothetical protein
MEGGDPNTGFTNQSGQFINSIAPSLLLSTNDYHYKEVKTP